MKKNNPLIDIEHDHYVYKITYDHGPEYYIGSRTKKPGERMNDYMGSSFTWENFMKKKGIENFTKVIISDFPTRKEANKHENDNIDLSDPFCMNKWKHPDGFSTAGTKTIHNPKTNQERMIPKDHEIPEGWVEGLSEKTKKKMSETHKGMKHTQEAKRKIAEALKGMKHTEERKRKIAESSIGKGRDYIIVSPENHWYYVTAPKPWAQEHFPDDWKYVNIAIANVAAGRYKTFMGGWTARIVEKE